MNQGQRNLNVTSSVIDLSPSVLKAETVTLVLPKGFGLFARREPREVPCDCEEPCGYQHFVVGDRLELFLAQLSSFDHETIHGPERVDEP